MIELISGRAGTGKSTCVLEGIRKDLALGKKIWLIVPEQQEIVWNGRAARGLPPDAFLHLEVAGFSSLAAAVMRETGGICYHYISSGGKALMMWKAILSVRSQLKVFGAHPGREDRYISTLADAVREMKTHRVTPQMLGRAAEEFRGGSEAEALLADRLSDLSLIASAYESMVRSEYDDSEDTLGRLADILSETNFFAGSVVYVDSYYSVTPVQAEILSHIFRQAEKVTVTFTLDREETAEPHWGPSRRFYNQMRGILAKQGLAYKETYLGENRRSRNDALQYLEANLWRHSAPPFAGENRAVSTIRVADRYEEADAAAGRVLELVHGGARYSEIAVIARNMESLRGVVDAAMENCGIPYYLAERTDVAMAPASRLLFSALAVAERSFRREDVLLCAKTGLTGLSEDECDAFERYTEKWKITSRRTFTAPGGWSMNPDGYTELWTEYGRRVLKEANDARDKLIPPLEAFAEAFSAAEAPTVESAARASVKLLTDYGVYEAIKEEARRLGESGRMAEASRTGQIWDALCDAFDTLVSILGKEPCDAGGFSRLLRRVITAADVGTIPSGVDEVVLGSADKIRPDNLRHVILLGAVDGEFPAAVADNSFFSDTDKIRLETAGIILAEGSASKAEEELFRFYRSASAASDSVTVLIPQSDTSGSLRPSSGALRVETLFPNAPRVVAGDFFVWNAASAVAMAPRLEGTATGDAAREVLSREGIFLPESGTLSTGEEAVTEITADALFGDKMILTQSRLEKFVGCPFSYYCRYVLKLDEDRSAEVSPVDVGNFVHAILERFFREIQGMPLPLPPGELEEKVASLVATYKKEVFAGVEETPRLKHLFGRLERNVRLFAETLSEEFAQSGFLPYRFEQKVEAGNDDAPPPLVFTLRDGTEISLVGTIDRLDVYREDNTTYVRVVDYKTGTKKFRLEDVAEGMNLQMLLYLFSISKMPPCRFREELAGDGDIVPAGVLYFSARPGEAKSDKVVSGEEARTIAMADVAREGLLLAEESVLRAMDREMAGAYIPVKMKKDGTLGKSSALASAGQFEEVFRLVSETVCRIGEAMKGGDASARPHRHGGKLPCDYCPERILCRRDEKKTEENEAE